MLIQTSLSILVVFAFCHFQLNGASDCLTPHSCELRHILKIHERVSSFISIDTFGIYCEVTSTQYELDYDRSKSDGQANRLKCPIDNQSMTIIHFRAPPLSSVHISKSLNFSNLAHYLSSFTTQFTLRFTNFKGVDYDLFDERDLFRIDWV